jgi:aminoglycoside 6'-N-acetyltransferase
MDVPTLQGALVTLRPARADDIDRLREILLQPEVVRWWGGPRDEPGFDVAADWLDADDSGAVFVIERDGRSVGSIQFDEELEPDYRHGTVDLFIEAAHQAQGIGPDAIRAVARYLFEVRGHHRLTIDPSAANERAIRAYSRVGFRPVGRMRSYERGPDGTWHDGLLMDLLRDELR